MAINRMDHLSAICARTHAPRDIVKHLREEMHELDLALDRLERGRGSLEDVVEEATDVKIEINTFFMMLEMVANINQPEMLHVKLNKFQRMIEEENEKLLSGELTVPIDRYQHSVVFPREAP